MSWKSVAAAAVLVLAAHAAVADGGGVPMVRLDHGILVYGGSEGGARILRPHKVDRSEVEALRRQVADLEQRVAE